MGKNTTKSSSYYYYFSIFATSGAAYFLSEDDSIMSGIFLIAGLVLLAIGIVNSKAFIKDNTE